MDPIQPQQPITQPAQPIMPLGVVSPTAFKSTVSPQVIEQQTPVQSAPPQKKHSSMMIPLLIVLVVIIVAGAAATYFITMKKPAQAPKELQKNAAVPTAPTATPFIPSPTQSLETQAAEEVLTSEPTTDIQSLKTELNQL